MFNGSSDFKVVAGTGLRPSLFIFATESGQIYGWNGVGTVAIQAVATPDAIYLGLAIGSVGSANYLYAANFHAGTVDVFNGTWARAICRARSPDPSLPEGYAPFGIQAIGGLIYVAYAKQDPDDPDEELPCEGCGYVDAFDTAGNFIEAGRVGRRTQRTVGPRHGTGELRQVQR